MEVVFSRGEGERGSHAEHTLPASKGLRTNVEKVRSGLDKGRRKENGKAGA